MATTNTWWESNAALYPPSLFETKILGSSLAESWFHFQSDKWSTPVPRIRKTLNCTRRIQTIRQCSICTLISVERRMFGSIPKKMRTQSLATIVCLGMWGWIQSFKLDIRGCVIFLIGKSTLFLLDFLLKSSVELVSCMKLRVWYVEKISFLVYLIIKFCNINIFF